MLTALCGLRREGPGAVRDAIEGDGGSDLNRTPPLRAVETSIAAQDAL